MYADSPVPVPFLNPDPDQELIERFVGKDAPQRLQWLNRVVFAMVRGGRLPPPPDCDVQLLMTTLDLNPHVSRVLTVALDPISRTDCEAISRRILHTEALHPVFAIHGLAAYVPFEVAERHLSRYAYFPEALADAALEAHREDLFKAAILHGPHTRRLIFENVARELLRRPDKAASAIRFAGSAHDLLSAFRSPATQREPEDLFAGVVELAWLERGVRPLILQGLELYRESISKGRIPVWGGIDVAISVVRGYA